MKIGRIGIMLLIGLAMAGAQDRARDPFVLINLQRLSFSQIDGQAITNCVLVQPDGSFRREYESMQPAASKSAEVYEGKLTPEQMQALVAAISSDDFKAIETGLPAGGLQRMADDVITINVLRPGGSQSLHFGDPIVRRRFDKTLKPLLAWWKSVEKMKLQKIKDAPSTGCRFDNKIMRKAIDQMNPSN